MRWMTNGLCAETEQNSTIEQRQWRRATGTKNRMEAESDGEEKGGTEKERDVEEENEEEDGSIE